MLHAPANNVSRALVVLALLVTALWGGATGAQGSDSGDLPLGGTFLDDDEMQQEGYIEALAATGITRGCNPPANDLFCPNASVTRGQVASFLVRALNLPDAAGANTFTDDDESPHEADIDALVAAGVTRGCNPPENDEFCPTRAVTRGEMAAFLVRAFDYEIPADADTFDDDDYSIFESQIEAIAAAGITSGCGGTSFCPESAIQRKNLAVFLARALDLEPIIPPPRLRVIGEFTTYHQCCESRVTNIHLIADAVDGVIVPAGETWSLNGHVGQRTEVGKEHVPADPLDPILVFAGGREPRRDHVHLVAEGPQLERGVVNVLGDAAVLRVVGLRHDRDLHAAASVGGASPSARKNRRKMSH